jgi:hypothetical protein
MFRIPTGKLVQAFESIRGGVHLINVDSSTAQLNCNTETDYQTISPDATFLQETQGFLGGLCHMCIMVTKEALVSIFRVEAKVKAA